MEEFEPFDWMALEPAPVIGIDEVGRGCLAGPVYAAAAIVPADVALELEDHGVTDSKLLSPKKRDVLAEIIRERALVGLGFATADEIDEINILQATFLAMRRALGELDALVCARTGVDLTKGAGFGPKRGHLLIDGNQKLPLAGSKFDRMVQTTLIKGDLRALPIAAASIVAKVTRDRLMVEAASLHPEYGFEKHKGYAAPIHREAIARLGPTSLHRKSFGGVREHVR